MTNQHKPGWWLPMVYYYLATAIGLVVLLFGLIGGLRGLVTAAIPEISSEVRYSSYIMKPDGTQASPAEEDKLRADAIERARIGGYADALYGAVAVVVGLPVFVWHLRQARRREPELLAAQAPANATPTT
jgi:ABC-type cobalamin transport system permease subunit